MKFRIEYLTADKLLQFLAAGTCYYTYGTHNC